MASTQQRSHLQFPSLRYRCTPVLTLLLTAVALSFAAVVAAQSGETEPAIARGGVKVTLKGGATIQGTRLEAEQGYLRLQLSGGGTLQLSESLIESMDALHDAALKPAAHSSQGAISTTHKVVLKNGSALRGSLLESSDQEPLLLEVGGYGVLMLDRERVEQVVEEGGKIEIPEAATAAPTQPERDPKDIDPRDTDPKDTDEARARRELERFAAEVVQARFADESPKATAEAAQKIQFYVEELGRNRTRNRVNAERHLAGFGSAVLPFLETSARHPFALTRRAVQRIVRKVGDAAGAPLAIHALTDSDEFVRELAAEAIGSLLAGPKIPLRPRPEQLRALQARYWEIWQARERQLLQDAIIATLEEGK